MIHKIYFNQVSENNQTEDLVKIPNGDDFFLSEKEAEKDFFSVKKIDASSLFKTEELIELTEKAINDGEVNPLIFTEEDLIDTTEAIKYQELNLSIFTREELEKKIYTLNDYINNGIEKIKSQYSELNTKDFEIDALKRQVEVLKHQQEQDKNKYSDEWWSNLSDKFYESNLAHDYKDGKIDYRHIRNWFIEQFKNK